jgi:hypothetical protein
MSRHRKPVGENPTNGVYRMFRSKRKLIGIVGIALAIVAFNSCFGMFETGLGEVGGPFPSHTIEESKRKGTLVSVLQIEPQQIKWHGKILSIKEIWLERRARCTSTIVVIPFFFEFPQYEVVGGYDVCFNLDQGKDLFMKVDSPFFVQKGRGAGIRESGTVVYSDSVAPDFQKLILVLTDNWKLDQSIEFSVVNPATK